MINRILHLVTASLVLALVACGANTGTDSPVLDGDLRDPHLDYRPIVDSVDSGGYRRINRRDYHQRLYGFWLGQSIGNWTGLVTEMDKIGGAGEHGAFYRREDWGQPDQPAIWGAGEISEISPTIDFVFRDVGEIWGADDDTDMEYIYQHALYENRTSLLTAEQIRAAWLAHIYDETKPTPYGLDDSTDDSTDSTDSAEASAARPIYQNYLWVSNQRAHTLMLSGMLPPQTSAAAHNPHGEMIDAQLTTEIFGFYAPTRPDIALRMAALPIRTVARSEAILAAEFYVILYALAPSADSALSLRENLHAMAARARLHLPSGSYGAAMYDYVSGAYERGEAWEDVRDGLYEKYQVNQEDGYDMSSRGLYCNGCFASGINFGASLISLFYGEGDIKRTIQIAVLCGWDSDNPAATWGGLLGFMLGKEGVEAAFGREFSSKFDIHRTRRGLIAGGIDDFSAMATKGVYVTDRAVQELLGGGIDASGEHWLIPQAELGDSV